MEEADPKRVFDQPYVCDQPNWKADLTLAVVPRVKLKGRCATELGSDPCSVYEKAACKFLDVVVVKLSASERLAITARATRFAPKLAGFDCKPVINEALRAQCRTGKPVSERFEFLAKP